MQDQPICTLAGLYPLPRASHSRFVTSWTIQSCCRINQESPGAGKCTVRELNTQRGRGPLPFTWWPGQGVPRCHSQNCSLNQPKELNRLCLLCSAKSQREKPGLKSGAHDSITACALFPRSPSLTLQGLDIPNFSGHGWSLMTCIFFRCPSSRGS